MSPKKIIFMMMRSLPRDYPSRPVALLKMFDDPLMHWHKGELVFIDEGNTLQFTVEHQAESRTIQEAKTAFNKLEGSECAPVDLIDYNEARRVLLSELRAQSEQAFVFNHAELLSQDTNGRLTANPKFNGLHFYDIPLDVTPEWLDAAIELATVIRNHALVPLVNFKVDDYARQAEQLKHAKTHAERLLIRMDMLELGWSEREALVDTLVRDAQSLWMSDDIIKGIESYRKPLRQNRKSV